MIKVLYLLSTLSGIIAINIVLQSTLEVCNKPTGYSINMLFSGVLMFLISVILLGYIRYIQAKDIKNNKFSSVQ